MSSLLSIVSQARGIRRWFVIALLCVGVETFFEVVIPMLMADIIDVGIATKNTAVFWRQGAWMIACALLAMLFGWIYSRAAAIASSRLAQILRRNEYDKIQSFAFANIDHFETSGLITRMNTDVNVIQNTITAGLRPIARSPMMLILGLTMSFLINWKISLVFFVISPVLILILVWIFRKVAPQYPLIQQTVDLLNNVIQENLTAIRVVKAFVRGKYEEEKFDTVNSRLTDITKNTFHYAQLNQPAFQLCMYTTIVVLMILGTQMILAGTMLVGELTGILSYVLQILNSFMMMSNVFLLLTRSMASINRINEVFTEKVELTGPENGAVMQDGSVEFRHVSFRYDSSGSEDAIEDITFTLNSGEKLGILGGTGSGKSTLVQLIPRLYDVSAGTIRVGKERVKDLDLEQLRNDVGMVLQNNVLFSGTVEENLRWGNPDATDEEIREACRIACVDEFLDRLDGGLQMELGQGGVNVSGGQKQRLCIARALLKKPKLLIFDDSTSAVDTKTDAKIREGLASLEGMSQIIIAQRISSVMHCDHILILQDGKMAGYGTHESLLRHNPIYKEIWETQNRGSEDE